MHATTLSVRSALSRLRRLAALASFVASTAFAALPDTTYKSGFEPCLAPAQYCADVDQDGFGDSGHCIVTCESPYDFFALPPTDCNNDSALINPGAQEICDGVDNDCNGGIDEDDVGGGAACITGLPGVCSAGVRHCSAGALKCQQSVPASAEICDSLDNDCDGLTDEEFPEKFTACSDGNLGVCAGTGTYVCDLTGHGTKCNITTPGKAASAEVCNGLDDNCDGNTDEGDPGGGAACSTGLPGVCATGVKHCSAGALACQQSVQPTAETCDGADNDCDGVVDEDFPEKNTACSDGNLGVCAGSGTFVCNAQGTGTTCSITTPGKTPSPEACNGLDDNCNGNIDEGNPGGGAACDTGLHGTCRAGTVACENGSLTCKPDMTGC